MDLPYGSDELNAFVTNVGLVTSNGPHGGNIMACEWTHQISYKPCLIAVCIGTKTATYKNISETEAFGVSIASSDQNILASLSGNATGKEVDKIAALTELGFTFEKGQTIDVPMPAGAILGLECTLKEALEEGDHVMCIGEAQHASYDADKRAVVFSRGAYWHYGEEVEKPSDDERADMKAVMEKHRK